jgi:hypothetical protein
MGYFKFGICVCIHSIGFYDTIRWNEQSRYAQAYTKQKNSKMPNTVLCLMALTGLLSQG